MESTVITIILIIAIISFVFAEFLKHDFFERGYDEGWEDCYKIHKSFEITDEDKVILDIIKKSLKEYVRKKKYVKDEDKIALDKIEDFEQLKHFIYLTCIYRKEFERKSNG